MATYEVEMEDGAKYRIEGADGLTDAEVRNAATHQHMQGEGSFWSPQAPPEGGLAVAGQEFNAGIDQAKRGVGQLANPFPNLESLKGLYNLPAGAIRALLSGNAGMGGQAGQWTQDATRLVVGDNAAAALAVLADQATQFATGAGEAKLLGKGAQLMTRAARPVFAAEGANAANAATHEGLMQQYLEGVKGRGEQAGVQSAATQAQGANDLRGYFQAVAKRGQQAGGAMADKAAANANVQRAGLELSQPGAGPMSRVSPLAERFRTPGTNAEIYQPFNDILETPVAMPGLTAKVDELMGRFGSAGVAPGMTPKSAIKATGEVGAAAGEMALPKDLAGLGPNALAQVKNALSAERGGAGGMTMGDAQINLQGIGKMARSSDAQTGAIGKQLYRAAIEDLATTPNGKLLLDANRSFSRNLAVDDLTDLFTKFGTDVNKAGAMKGELKALKSFSLDSNPIARFVKRVLTPEELQGMESTLKDIGMMSRNAADLPVVKGVNLKGLKEPAMPPSGGVDVNLTGLKEPTAPKLVTAQAPAYMPWQLRSTLHAAAAAINYVAPGYGIGANLAIEVPRAYSKMIFKLASKPSTQPILRAIFRGSPPNLHNVAQMSAVANAAHASDSAPQ